MAIKPKGLKEYLEDDPSLLKKYTYEELTTYQYGFDDSGIEEAYREYCKLRDKLSKEETYTNYVKLHNIIPWRSSFAYLDSKEYWADQIFVNHELRVNFKEDYSHPNSPFLVILCSIPKRKESIFMTCMDRLRNKFLIVDKSEKYLPMCKWLHQNFDKDYKED